MENKVALYLSPNGFGFVKKFPAFSFSSIIAQSISNLESENQSEFSILQNQKFWLPFSAAACVNMLSFGTTVPFGRTRFRRGSTADVALVQIVIAVQHTNIKAEMRFLSF